MGIKIDIESYGRASKDLTESLSHVSNARNAINNTLSGMDSRVANVVRSNLNDISNSLDDAGFELKKIANNILERADQVQDIESKYSVPDTLITGAGVGSLPSLVSGLGNSEILASSNKESAVTNESMASLTGANIDETRSYGVARKVRKTGSILNDSLLASRKTDEDLASLTSANVSTITKVAKNVEVMSNGLAKAVETAMEVGTSTLSSLDTIHSNELSTEALVSNSGDTSKKIALTNGVVSSITGANVASAMQVNKNVEFMAKGIRQATGVLNTVVRGEDSTSNGSYVSSIAQNVNSFTDSFVENVHSFSAMVNDPNGLFSKNAYQAYGAHNIGNTASGVSWATSSTEAPSSLYGANANIGPKLVGVKGDENVNKVETILNTTPGTSIKLPSKLGDVYVYEGWQLITNKTSLQYKLKQDAGMNFDSEGIGVIDGRYVVATTSTFGKVGDYIDVVQSNGNVLKCIIGDIKNPSDPGCNKWGHLNGQCVVEFVVDKETYYGKKNNFGTDSNHPEWKQYVTEVINRGNYWDIKEGKYLSGSAGSTEDVASIQSNELGSSSVTSSKNQNGSTGPNLVGIQASTSAQLTEKQETIESKETIVKSEETVEQPLVSNVTSEVASTSAVAPDLAAAVNVGAPELTETIVKPGESVGAQLVTPELNQIVPETPVVNQEIPPAQEIVASTQTVEQPIINQDVQVVPEAVNPASTVEQPIINQTATEATPEIVMTTPASGTGYNSKPEAGFVVTTGNQTYNLSDSDLELLTAIVAAECDKSGDDALAVITTILNRCESQAWIRSHGTNPVKQATAPNQFVVYQKGAYKRYMGNAAPPQVAQAVRDALGGVRNHNYLSFRSNGSTGYSNNMITSSGNRYK